MRRLAALVTTVVIGALVVPAAPLTEGAAAYPGSHVRLEGAGWGHGRGMGQYGALGYAVNHGWRYGQILDHFYGNTGVGSKSDGSVITVRLHDFDDRDTIVTHDHGHIGVEGVGSGFAAVLISRVGTNTFDVYEGSGCGGPWGDPIKRITDADGVRIWSPHYDGSDNEMLQACERDGTRRWYRGELRAVDHDGTRRTLNDVKMGDYLRGVVPRESPASWGDLGNRRGMEALKAQAVAARSYAWAENGGMFRDPAKTCDTTSCQVYKGRRDTEFGVREHANTNEAIAQTAGEVRARDGSVQRSEFSSSTGGWTAGGTFPAVEDEGDSISANPNHRWTGSVPVSSIERSYPSIGTLRAVEVTERNGLGAWGGRAVEVTLRGTRGSTAISGDELRSRFGLKSDWFRVVNNPSGGVTGYWVLDSSGGIFTFGDADFHGSVPGLVRAGHRLGRAEIVDIAATPSGNGYWVLDAAGGIFSFGDAEFHGSVPGLRQEGVQVGASRILSLVPTRTGDGYWILDESGGMFSFGDADFHGSVPALRRAGHSIGSARVEAMSPTRAGDGYWVIDEDGGVFAFGDADFHGSMPALRRAGHSIGRAEVVDLAASTAGYWMLDDRGGLFAFGDARFRGSLPGAGISGTAIGIEPTKTGGGYLIVTAEGARVHPFGDAPNFGDVADLGVDATGRGVAVRYRR